MLPGQRRLLRLTLTLLLAGGAVAVAHAFALRVSMPHLEDGRVWATVRLGDPLDARIERTLQRGAPATLMLHAELWRRRGGWFDRFEQSFDASLRLRYLVADDAYVLDRAGAPRLVTHTLDSLELALSRPIGLPVATESQLESGARYYVVVTATLKPLSVEDLEEVEGWLSGEAREQRASGAGVITALPRSVFDALRNVVGFGDTRARGSSPDFTVPSGP